jgi:hypothetical protein
MGPHQRAGYWNGHCARTPPLSLRALLSCRPLPFPRHRGHWTGPGHSEADGPGARRSDHRGQPERERDLFYLYPASCLHQSHAQRKVITPHHGSLERSSQLTVPSREILTHIWPFPRSFLTLFGYARGGRRHQPRIPRILVEQRKSQHAAETFSRPTERVWNSLKSEKLHQKGRAERAGVRRCVHR